MNHSIGEKGEEWCISSQSVWGVPIPVFHIKESKGQKFLIDKTVVDYVRENFEKYGSDIWWSWNVIDLLPPKYKDKAELLEKGNLVFDIWFESGCAWHAILCKRINERKYVVDIEKGGESLLSSAVPEVVEAEAEAKESREIVPKGKDLKENFPADMIIEGLDQNDGLIQSMCLVAGNLESVLIV